jgi:endoglucanase
MTDYRSFFRVLCSVVVLSASASASLMVNQAGYLPRGQKLFFSTAAADSFRIVDAASGDAVYSGRLSVSKLNDAATGMNLYKGDFSALQKAGTYRVMLSSSSDASFPFTIADTVYEPVFRKALKGFYYQRCGVALPAVSAGAYARAACHLSDGVFHATAESTGTRAAAGGWHDAGDFGKYVVNAGVTAGTLLLSYELFPSRFAADDLGIPESGNGVPDLLDEVRYELAWMLKMQHSTGGVFCKLTRAQFEGFVMPSADNTTRYIYQISSAATGDFAAVCARASRVYRAFDPAFADTCLAAARRAWTYLKAHPAIVPTGGFKNPSGTATGEYGDSNDLDERLWAAAELFAATGESQFHTYYSVNYNSGALVAQTMSWGNVRTMAHLAYLYAPQAMGSAAVKTELRQSMTDYAAALVSQAGAEGFRVAIHPGEYAWGSNSEVLNRSIVLILASRESASPSMLGAAQSQLDYILGANAHNLSFVTGVGAHHVMTPHHRTSASDGVTEPVPGLLAGGPDQWRDDAVLQSKFTSSTPPALIYADNQDSYASNEIAINWNAPLVFAAGYFAGEGNATGLNEGVRGDVVPEHFMLEQNYPNPFNPSTSIAFTLAEPSIVSLNVFDSAGRRVASLAGGELAIGTHRVTLDGSRLSSGVYFYRLFAQHEGVVVSETKRAVLMK